MSTPMSLRLPTAARPVRLGALAAIESTPIQQTRGTVVLVPGYTGSKEDFLSILEQLTDAGHRVVTYDQRGQYESTGDEDPATYGLEALAGDLLEVMGDEPAHVVGHSFGGLVSRLAAIREPGRFASLTLLDSGPSAIPGERAERVRTLRPVLLDGGKPAVWERMVELSAGGEPSPEEIGAFMRARFFASSATGLLVMGDTLLAESDRTEHLRGTGIPLLVAYGEDDDAWPPAVQHEMAHRLGAEHAVIAGARHSPPVEQADATASVLLEFWASVEAARQAPTGTA
jgi:pimeloyl-ACP methyl ester carboxylesterase